MWAGGLEGVWPGGGGRGRGTEGGSGTCRRAVTRSGTGSLARENGCSTGSQHETVVIATFVVLCQPLCRRLGTECPQHDAGVLPRQLVL